MDTIVALLPMKDHSERVPGKNLKYLCGKPLFFWVLESLSRVPAISDVVVNTDSAEISRLASKHFDVVIHERPEDLRGDHVSMNRIIEYDIERIDDAQTFLQTHATNPLLELETISAAISAYRGGLPEYDSLFSVTTYHDRFYDTQANPLNHDPNELGRTQDLEPIYLENSNIYLFSRESFAKRGHRIGMTPQCFEISRTESVDIDEHADWHLAEALLSRREGRDMRHDANSETRDPNP